MGIFFMFNIINHKNTLRWLVWNCKLEAIFDMVGKFVQYSTLQTCECDVAVFVNPPRHVYQLTMGWPAKSPYKWQTPLSIVLP